MTRSRQRPLSREVRKLIFLIEEMIIDGHFDRVPSREAGKFDTALNRVRKALAEEEAA